MAYQHWVVSRQKGRFKVSAWLPIATYICDTYCLSVNSENKKLYSGKLLDLLERDGQGKKRVLNILEIKMGGAPIPPPPCYRYVFSLTTIEGWPLII